MRELKVALITICRGQLALLLLLCLSSKAGNYTISKFLTKSQIYSHAQIALSDPEYLKEFSQTPAVHYVSARECAVSLVYGREGRTDVVGSIWSLDIQYSITLTDDLGHSTTYSNQALTISKGAAKEILKAVNNHTVGFNFKQASITITGHTPTGTVPDDIKVDIGLSNEKFEVVKDDYSPVTDLLTPKLNHSVIDANPTVSGDQLMKIFWSYIPGAESYDLEWVFLDKKNVSYNTYANTSNGSVFTYLEPTRVNTSNNHFELNLIYPDGRLFYRIRPVGRFIDVSVAGDYDHIHTGKWYWITSGAQVAYYDVSVSNAYEVNKNWQVVQTFAEGAKNKKVITIADENLRARQMLTNLSTNQQTVVAETKYDYEGRPVINILPAVVPGADLSYKNGFNLAASGGVFSREHFDMNSGVESLASTTGAEKYYSPDLNSSDYPFAQNMDYIPRAGGYPFTQVRYMKNSTGKIERQSGVGPLHKIDDESHDTKYFYATPSESQLRSLFGSNVGNADHYKKVVTQDPNEQLSANYLDQEGRTIATSLIGKSPNNLQPLDYNVITDITESYPSRWDEVNKSYNLDASVFNDYSKPYQFKYDFSSLVSSLPACISCKYSLEIGVQDPDGNNVVLSPDDLTGFTLTTGFPQITGAINTACTGSQNVNLAFHATFSKVGTYSIYKRLKLRTPELDADLVEELEGLYDIPDSAALIAQFTSGLDFSICDPFCTGPACISANVTGEMNSNMLNFDCDYYKAQMKNQLTAGYYTYNVQTSTSEYHVGGYYFDNLGGLSGTQTHNNDWLLSEIGSLPPTAISDILEAAAICDPCTWEDVRSNWFPEFGDLLLPYHPEYCFIEDANGPTTAPGSACQTINDCKFSEFQLSSIPTNWEEATGVIGHPVALDAANTSILVNFVANLLTGTTPFHDKVVDISFAPTGGSSTILSFLQNRLTNFVTYQDPLCTGGGCANFTISLEKYVDPYWNLTTNTSSSQIVNPIYSGIDINDAAVVSRTRWNLYKTLYFNERNRVLKMYAQSLGYNTSGGCGLGIPDGVRVVKLPDWFDPTPQVPAPSVASINAAAASQAAGASNSMSMMDCGQIRAAQIDYWVRQIRANCNNATNQPGVPDYLYPETPLDFEDDVTGNLNITTGTPTTLREYLAKYYNNNAIINDLQDDCSTMPIPQIPNSVLYTWGAISGGPFNNTYFNIQPVCSIQTGCIMPGYGCEDRVITWMGLLIDECDQLRTTAVDISTTTLPLTTVCGRTFSSYCATHDPVITSSMLSDYAEFYLTEYCEANSNILNGSLRLKHDAITADPNLQAVELALAEAECISLHEIVSEDNPETGPCPKPSPCFATLTDYIVNHQSQISSGKLYVTDPYLMECIGLTNRDGGGTFIKINNPVPGIDAGDIGYFNVYSFPQSGSTYSFPLLSQLSVPGGQMTYQFFSTPSAPPVEGATFSGLGICYTIRVSRSNPEQGTKFVYERLCGYVYCVAPNSEGIAPSSCALTVQCDDPAEDIADPCHDFILAEAYDAAIHHWEQLIQDALTDYLQQYQTKCKNLGEVFAITHPTSEYHYTLYYYDQAGNLVQTVPPEGVFPLAIPALGISNANFSASGKYIVGSPNPAHELLTKYKYNALNAVVAQSTPDAGLSKFWYNRAGQLRFSQNRNQYSDSLCNPVNLKMNRFSYTKYDQQARILAVGEVEDEATQTICNTLNSDVYAETTLDYLDDLTKPDFSLGTYNNTTFTFYDGIVRHSSFANRNYRSRVSASYLVFNGTSIANPSNASFYQYDPSGNVTNIIQRIDGYGEAATSYEYDLISGKVNKVLYNTGGIDAFYHKYEYDADNRITNVYTSNDNHLWDEDAQYFYYPHGPLARVELGEDKVQGLDYYYTIHGWLKGVNMPHHVAKSGATTVNTCASYNSTDLPGLDPGKDGYGTGNPLNKYIARDQAAFALGYYNGDYTPAHTVSMSNPVQTAWTGSVSDNVLPAIANRTASRPAGLYNGNISWMMTDIPAIERSDLPNIIEPMQTMSYQYDQLNRLMQTGRNLYLNACGTTDGGGYTPSAWHNNASFTETYDYDRNGNITSLNRYGNGATKIDELEYKYKNGTSGRHTFNNRLYHVSDNISSGVAAIDIDDQGALYLNMTTGEYSNANYEYDAIGNLTKDVAEEIDAITWNVYGKIATITRPVGSTKDDLEFIYDAAGNRVAKIVKTKDSGGDLNAETNWSTTYYLRDATGNVMSTYTKTQALVGESQVTTCNVEQNIYGSSRVGLRRVTVVDGVLQKDYTNDNARVTTYKAYELVNHLGNVLATVSDRRIGHNNGGTADHYMADVTSAQDYYPFGSVMPGRSFSTPAYRFGFNGKDKDDEVKGSSNSLDFGARVYDPRIGRFLSPDPLVRKFPDISCYAFAANRPIVCIDAQGQNPIIYFLIPLLGVEKLAAKVTNKVVYTSVGIQIEAGMGALSGGYKRSYALSADPMGNFAISTTFGGFVDLFSVQGGKSYDLMKILGSKPVNGGGLEEGQFYFGGTVGAGVTFGYYNYDDVEQIQGKFQEGDINTPVGGATVSGNPDLVKQYAGLAISPGPLGKGMGAGFGMMTTNTEVFAFTAKDVDQIADASASAVGDYAKFSIDKNYTDVSVNVAIKNTASTITVSFIVSGKNSKGESVTLASHDGLKVNKKSENYWETSNVKHKK